jgi:hypothetical protein
MSDSFWWLAILSRAKVRRPRWFFPLVVVFLVGLILAGMIYAFVVVQAVSERNNTHHVSTPRSH